MLRALGFVQSTGFNAPNAPSLVDRVVAQLGQFGTSYVLLLVCPLAGVVAALSASPARRFLGLVAVTTGLFGVYSAAFGTFEEQYGYPVMIAGIVAAAVSAVELSERFPRARRAITVVCLVFVAVAVALGVRAEATTDDGFLQVRDWMRGNLPADARVGVTNSTGDWAFGESPRVGVGVAPRPGRQRGVLRPDPEPADQPRIRLCPSGAAALARGERRADDRGRRPDQRCHDALVHRRGRARGRSRGPHRVSRQPARAVGMPDVLGRCRRGFTAVGAAVLVASLTACRMSAAEPAGALSELTVGVLGGSCDADRVTALRQAGVRLVEVGVEWSRFEPAPQQFDQAYIDDLRARFARCAAAGLGVVLTPGFQYAPDWVVELPDGTYLDQYGNSHPARPRTTSSARPSGTPSSATSTASPPSSRSTASRRYGSGRARRGSSASRAGNSAPRATASGPSTTPRSPATGSPPGCSRTRCPAGNPASGPGTAARSTPQPSGRGSTGTPTRRPGRRSGRSASCASRHYRGPIHLPLAGRGVLPARPRHGDRSSARRHRRPRREPGTRLVLPRPAADDRRRDRPGHPLRRRHRGRRRDRRGGAPTGPAAGHVPTLGLRRSRCGRPPRSTRGPRRAGPSANARAAGLRVVGENPGHPDTPGTGGDESSDDLAAQLVHAPRYAQECGLEVLLWAFEDDLFGPYPEVSLDDLARRIHE